MEPPKEGRRRAVAASIAVLLAATVLAGCAGGQYGNASPPPENQVDITDGSFDPASITVTVNRTIMWTNVGDETHKIVSFQGPTTFSSLDMAPGDHYTFTPTKPGVYEYRDQYNSQSSGDGYSGMTGEIIVRSG